MSATGAMEHQSCTAQVFKVSSQGFTIRYIDGLARPDLCGKECYFGFKQVKFVPECGDILDVSFVSVEGRISPFYKAVVSNGPLEKLYVNKRFLEELGI